MSKHEEPYTPTPGDEAIQASLLTVGVVGQIQQAYVDGKIDKETYSSLFEAARKADEQVRKLARMIEKESQAAKQTSTCHSSARCDENQRVMLSGEERQETVHNVHGVQGYDLLFGFVKRRDGDGREGVRKVAGSDVWEPYTGSGL